MQLLFSGVSEKYQQSISSNKLISMSPLYPKGNIRTHYDNIVFLVVYRIKEGIRGLTQTICTHVPLILFLLNLQQGIWFEILFTSICNVSKKASFQHPNNTVFYRQLKSFYIFLWSMLYSIHACPRDLNLKPNISVLIQVQVFFDNDKTRFYQQKLSYYFYFVFWLEDRKAYQNPGVLNYFCKKLHPRYLAGF